MNSLAFVCAAVVTFIGPTGCVASESTSLAVMPTTRPGREDAVALREVEVTLLGSTSDLKGMRWVHDPENRHRSQGIEEPCNLTVRLPNGKLLKMRTRPILIVSRVMPTNVIGSVDAPPEGERGSLREKADEVERLLTEWQITPDPCMQTALHEWKQNGDPGTGIGGRMRIGVALDDRTQVAFRVSSGGPGNGGWHLVVEIAAKAEEWQRAREAAAETRPTAATQPH